MLCSRNTFRKLSKMATVPSRSSSECGSVFEYGLRVLNTSDPHRKAELTLQCAAEYASKLIPMGDATTVPLPPDTPARPAFVAVMAPGRVHKRRGAGTLKNRTALIHSFCHIECWAIDLSWDLLVRFTRMHSPPKPESSSLCSISAAAASALSKIDALLEFVEEPSATSEVERRYFGSHGVVLPLEFYEDWLRIAAEEAKHFSMWSARLEQLGAKYGDFAAHDGLWSNARDTSDCLLARLAIVHLVLEGRGLDVTLPSKGKLQRAGDEVSAQLLETIFRDEITHVASGIVRSVVFYFVVDLRFVLWF